MLAGFIAENAVHSHALEKDAVEIEGEAVSHDSGVKEQLPEPVLHLVGGADVEKGKKISKACASCHSFDKGGPVKTGPTLWNIVGRKKGSKSGFGYSSAMAEAGGTWTYADLNKFLWKPKKTIPGTKMNFIGLKKPEDRAAIIAWLRTLSDSPKAMPSSSEIAAEKAELLPEEAADIAPEAGDMIEEISAPQMMGPPSPEVLPQAAEEKAQEPNVLIPPRKPFTEE